MIRLTRGPVAATFGASTIIGIEDPSCHDAARRRVDLAARTPSAATPSADGRPGRRPRRPGYDPGPLRARKGVTR